MWLQSYYSHGRDREFRVELCCFRVVLFGENTVSTFVPRLTTMNSEEDNAHFSLLVRTKTFYTCSTLTMFSINMKWISVTALAGRPSERLSEDLPFRVFRAKAARSTERLVAIVKHLSFWMASLCEYLDHCWKIFGQQWLVLHTSAYISSEYTDEWISDIIGASDTSIILVISTRPPDGDAK